MEQGNAEAAELVVTLEHIPHFRQTNRITVVKGHYFLDILELRPLNWC